MSEPRSFKQELVCVFGQPVAENPTQAMMEAAFKHHNLDWRYLTIEVLPEDLGDAIRGLRAMNFRGGNLTIPHKVAVRQYLDDLSEAAELMGAVNCMMRIGDQLIGENTDGKGFVESLREVSDPQGKKVVILGAGGAARAIAVELALAGATDFTIVNRGHARGSALVHLLNKRLQIPARQVPWVGDFSVPAGTDVVINATSIGLYPHVNDRVPVALDSLHPGMVVADVIPNPPKTRFVEEAIFRGCTVLDGLGMLVNQGVIGFKWWTGINPDRKVMRWALEEVFSG